jgi:hypothetical protein
MMCTIARPTVPFLSSTLYY